MSTISENTIAESAVAGESVNQGQYIFDFEVAGLEISAADNQSEGAIRQDDGATVYDHFRPALRAEQSSIGNIDITSDADVSIVFEVDDTATFSLINADSAYEFEGLILEFQDDYAGLPIAPIATNAIGDIQYEGPQNFQPGLIELSIGSFDDTIKSTSRITQGDLQIGAADNDDGRAPYVRPEDGKEEWPWFRPALEFEQVDTGVLSLVNLTGDSTAYLFASPGIDRLENYAGLPISPISVNAIGTLQYEGVMDYQPSIGEKHIGATSVDNLVANYTDTAGLSIGVTWNDGVGVVRDSDGKTEYPYFRPALEVDRSFVTFKSLAAYSVEYKFENDLNLQIQTGAGIPIGPISYSSISEEQQIAGGSSYAEVFTDTISLEISATDLVSEVSKKVYTFSDQAELEVDADGVITIVVDDASEAALDITASDTIGKKFVYDDTATFSVLSGSSIISISGSVEVTPLLIGATSVVSKSFNIIDSSAALELSTSLSNVEISYNTEPTTLQTELGSSEDLDIIYKPIQGQRPNKNFIVNASFRQTSNSAYEYILELDTTDTKDVDRLVDSINNSVNYTGYDLTDSEVYITFWKQGVIQHAIRQLSLSQTNTVYNYNKPRAQSSTINNVQKIILDTNPRSLSFVAANFDSVNYNLTTTGFEFDEIRYYQGDPANYDDVLLWSAVVSADLQITGSDDIVNIAAQPTQFVPLEIDLTEASLASYKVPDEAAEFEIAATFLQTNRYNYRDFGTFIKGGASGIVVTLGTVDTTALVISDADQFSFLYNYTDYTHNLGELTLSDSSTNSVIYAYTDLVHNLGELEIDASSILSRAYAYDNSASLGIDALYPFEITVNVIDSSSIEIASTDSVTQIFNYTETGVFSKLAASDTSIAYNRDALGELELSAASDNSITYNFLSQTDIEATASSLQENTFAFAVTQGLEIDAESQLSRVYTYDDTGIFSKLGASSTEITYNRDALGELEVGATSQESIAYSYDDSANLGIVTVSDQAITYVISTVEFVTFDATSIDNKSTNVVTETSLELESQTQFSRTFAYDDTANIGVVTVGDEEATYVFDTVEFVSLDAISIENKSTSVVNTTLLEIDTVEIFSTKFVFDDTATLGVVTVSDEETTYVFDTVEFVTFDAVSQTNILSNNVDNSALELQSDQAISVVYEFDSQLGLDISDAATQSATITQSDVANIGVLGAVDTEVSYSFDTVDFFSLASSDTIEVIYNDLSTAELIASDTSIQSSTHVFEDTTNLGVISIIGTEISYDYQTAEFVTLEATDVLEIIYTYATPAEIIVSDTSTQSSTHIIEDTTNLGVLGAVSSEVSYNYENVDFITLAATSEIQVSYALTEQPALDIGADTTQNIIYSSTDDSILIEQAVDSIEVTHDIIDSSGLQLDSEPEDSISLNFVPQVSINIAASDEVIYAQTFEDDIGLSISIDSDVNRNFIIIDDLELELRVISFINSGALDTVKQRWSSSNAITSSNNSQIWID